MLYTSSWAGIEFITTVEVGYKLQYDHEYDGLIQGFYKHVKEKDGVNMKMGGWNTKIILVIPWKVLYILQKVN